MLMERRGLRAMLVVLVGLGLGARGAEAWDAHDAEHHDTKVSVCHIPPGHPANAHIITIDDAALSAHLAHGDVVLPHTFRFYSGAAHAAFLAHSGIGPITTGVGAVGAPDPITMTDYPGPAHHAAVLVTRFPTWALLPGTQWISYADTSLSGPPALAITDFFVPFYLPGTCGTHAQLAVAILADNNVTLTLNGHAGGWFWGDLPGHDHQVGFTVVGHLTVGGHLVPGLNVLELAVQEIAGPPDIPANPHGLDFSIAVTMPAGTGHENDDDHHEGDD